ncbi:glycosyltransferase family 4 protein [Nitratifractor sp.]
MKTVYFLRRSYTPFGGSERDFLDLYDTIRENSEFPIAMIDFRQPSWLPGWLRLLLYDRQAYRFRKHHTGILFSSDRLGCLDIHKAGGGTHKSFLRTKGFSLNPLHPTYLWLEKRTLRNARKIIAVSKLVKDDIIHDYRIPAEKIEVIYNGIRLDPIDDATIAQNSTAIRREFSLPDGVPIILFVGSGFRRKGVREFLELLHALRSDFRALVVGKEKRLAHYRALARKLGLDKRVIFTGPRTDVRKFYCASEIFLFPTHYEPFGNVVLEAMQYGNAVITTRQCGAGELLGEEPRMADPADRTILPFLENLLQDPDKRRAIAAANRERVKQHDIRHNARALRRIIRELEDA